jgi:hypothetical protein
MRLLRSLFVFTSLACGAATLTITPPTIYDCQNGYATAALTWSGASGPVQIHVLQPAGSALTGFNDPSGSTTTGNWVGDGLQFFLVNQAGIVEATATAHVSCGGTPQTLDQGLQGGSYFPLQIGNTWVYRYNDRSITGSFLTRSITGTEVINGLTYYVMTEAFGAAGPNVAGKFRGDDNGVTWMMTNSGEQVYLDPRAPGPSGGLQATSYSGALGTFTDAVTTSGLISGIELDRSIFVRGIGLANLQAQLETGSSGGFAEGLDLVEVRLNGVRLSLPSASLNLSIETTDLDLTDQKVANCALPCYFVACGLGAPAPDPGGTYRPCAQIRLETSATSADSVQLQLLDSTGSAVFSATGLTGAGGGSFDYVRLPLYTSQTGSNSFTLLPAGNYQLVGRALAAGSVTASSAITVRVR